MSVTVLIWSGVSRKTVAVIDPSQMQKIRFSNFQTLETIENFMKFCLLGN